MSEPEFFFDVQQGTPEWFELRRGIPTASNFAKILANGKMREDYMYKLAGEMLIEDPSARAIFLGEGFTSLAMQRGHEMEGEAREYFADKNKLDVQQCGFVRRALPSGRYAGASPDGLFKALGKAVDSLLEIKTMRPDLMIKARRGGYNPNKCPSEHEAQVQGGLWITGMKRAELIVYYRGMPYSLLYSVGRDETFIAKIAAAVARFDIELAALVLENRGYP